MKATSILFNLPEIPRVDLQTTEIAAADFDE